MRRVICAYTLLARAPSSDLSGNKVASEQTSSTYMVSIQSCSARGLCDDVVASERGVRTAVTCMYVKCARSRLRFLLARAPLSALLGTKAYRSSSSAATTSINGYINNVVRPVQAGSGVNYMIAVSW